MAAPLAGLAIRHLAESACPPFAVLHDLGLVHTDLKPENILLVDSDFVSVPYRVGGKVLASLRIRPCPLTALSQPTKANPTVKQKRLLKNASMHLIDFGSATFEEEYHASVVSTRHYRAPEIILGG